MIEELDKISSIYGQGKYADTSKYSVTVGSQTIASGARGIKLNDIGCTINITPTTKTYTKNADDGYIYIDGIESDYTIFNYWGEDANPRQGAQWKTLGSGESVTIAYYGYTQSTRTNAEKEMLFGNENDGYKNYWLVSYYAYHSEGYASFGGRRVTKNYIGRIELSYSKGVVRSSFNAIRPLVYLQSDIQLSYNSETGAYTIVEQ